MNEHIFKSTNSPSPHSRNSDDYASILTNFPVTSRKSLISSTNRKDIGKFSTENKINEVKFMINGENFYSKMKVLNKQVEAIEDGYSAKGEYLYIQKGSRVVITNVLGEFAEVVINGHTGYFPTYIFRHT